MLQNINKPRKQGLFNLFDEKGSSEDTFSDSSHGTTHDNRDILKRPSNKIQPYRSEHHTYIIT